jgi:circadian clock protein KaiB
MTDSIYGDIETGDDDEGERYILRLYVAGNTPRSRKAIENVRKICKTHLDGRYDLEIIDIYQEPESASREQIIAVPTLVKSLPGPLRRIIGDLSHTEKVLHSFDLRPYTQEEL